MIVRPLLRARYRRTNNLMDKFLPASSEYGLVSDWRELHRSGTGDLQEETAANLTAPPSASPPASTVLAHRG